MNISSTPFIRNDYWPDYNDIDTLNKRIDEAENETSLVNSRLTNDIENVSNNLNSYKNEMADTVITNNIIVNNLNANYAVGKYANFINTNTDNAYIENLTVNKPVFDITLNTPHIENATSLGGNFYDANLINPSFEGTIGLPNLDSLNVNSLAVNTANVKELFVNTQPEPVTSSAVLGYDSEGRVIPVHAAFDVGFPEDANYLFTDHAGTAFPGTAATEVGISSNLITAYAVKNAIDNVNDSLNIINSSLNDADSWMNTIENDVNNRFEETNNSINYLKNIVESSLLPANITGWDSSAYPVIIQDITEFAVEPISADYYPISPESERICISGNYYKKNGNNYVKRGGTATYNTYDNSIPVSWDPRYIAHTDYDFETMTEVTTWRTSNNQLATSGYYLSVDKQLDDTYRVQLLKLTFDEKGTLTDGAAIGALYKLPSDFNFQDSVTYYVKNGNNFEGLKVNQGQCTFTTNPATDNNFYIYQKGADWSYPNTTGPQYSVLARNNVYAGVYSTSSFPLYTEIETMTAYVGDKAKLSVSGTKATLALPGLYWTKANMDMAFYNCSSFNQKMIIPNSVTSMVSTFDGCSSFNQSNMYIYSQNITNMTNAFKGCNINNVHIPTSVPKDTSNFMYNCLVNGNTGITFPASNIFNDLN